MSTNYFNTLSLKLKLEELGTCRFMQESEFSNGISSVKNLKIVIVGCGAQGLNQGLNMRDSGLDISYALRENAILEKRQSFINASENFLTKVPDSMSSEYAAPLFCPGITAYKAVKAAEPEKNKKIAIYGIGGVGHMAIQFAKVEGCEVTGISRKKEHLNVAEKLGAGKTFQFTESQEEFLTKVKDDYGYFDAAVVFAPSDMVTDTAIKSVKKGGTVIIATVGKILNFLAFEEKTVRGTLIGSMKDMEKVIEIAQKNNFKVVTESFPLEQANEVLERLKNSDIEARAVLIP